MALFARDRGRRLEETRPAPALTPATLVQAGDRSGVARLDIGGYVSVTLPNVMMGLRAGERVRLFRYPDGWVVVQRIVIRPPLTPR